MESLPTFQEAIQQAADGQLHIIDNAPLPSLPSGYVLVKTHAVAIQPSDNKILANFPLAGAFTGTDFSGTVVQAASDVDSLSVGDQVSGVAFLFNPEHRLASGAFSQYVRARADVLFKCKPSFNLDLAESSTLGTAIATCILSFWAPDSLNLTGTPAKPLVSSKPVRVLVYGGSTATGTIAIQLLKLSGYDPIATCSPHNFDLVTSRGASAVFDYSKPECAKDISDYAAGTLKYALDCISDESSSAICYQAIQRVGGRYVSLESVPDDSLASRRAIVPTFVLAAEAYDEDVRLGSDVYDRRGDPAKHELTVTYMRLIQKEVLDRGLLRAHPVERLTGGLQGVLEGMTRLAEGKVSGRKLVAVVDGSE